jgi:hypothetical protein
VGRAEADGHCHGQGHEGGQEMAAEEDVEPGGRQGEREARRGAAQGTGGAPSHLHTGFSESFYVLSGKVWRVSHSTPVGWQESWRPRDEFRLPAKLVPVRGSAGRRGESAADVERHARELARRWRSVGRDGAVGVGDP